MSSANTFSRSSRHEANVQAKAKRALESLVHMAEHSIVPDPQFPATNLVEGLELLRRYLFEDGTYEDRAAWWTALGIQDQLLNGGDEPTTFGESRPYIAVCLDVKINTLRLVDPFAGLAF